MPYIFINAIGPLQTYQPNVPLVPTLMSHALTSTIQEDSTSLYNHNEIRDFMANISTEVCHDAWVEPHLQPLSSEAMSTGSPSVENNARLDIAAINFCGGRF